MKKVVLLVDDEIGALTLVGIALERGGFTVLKAKDADSALGVLDYNTPDLIITDVMMPGMDGIELCKIIRDRPDTRSTPILILSARGSAESVMRGMEAGANDYLPKPILFHDLVAKVHSMLGESSFPSDHEGETVDLLELGIGQLAGKAPEVVLKSLTDVPREGWAQTLNDLLADVDTSRRGRAVIALALWQKASDAPFIGREGQRFFWEHVRHSLGSITTQEADHRWGVLAPVARGLIQPAGEIDEALVECLRSENGEVRQWALKILHTDRAPGTAAEAARLLDDSHTDVRATAAAALGDVGGDSHVPLLARALSDAEAGIRQRAAEALAKLDSDISRLALMTTLQDGSAEAAEAVAHELAIHPKKAFVPTLIETARQRNEPRVLIQLAHALGKHETKRCHTALRRLAKHPDELVQRAARQYVKR